MSLWYNQLSMRLFTSFLLLFISNFIIAQQTENYKTAELIDSLLKESNRRGIFNGSALVAKQGQVVYRGAIGYADASKNKPLNLNLRFNIGSISKEFDGMGIMILKEEGKLSLEDSLSSFFPDLPDWASRITIRNLLQYTSGLSAPGYNKELTDAQVWQYLHKLEKLMFEPGTDYNYNNADVFLRKRIIEKASGLSYAGFVAEKMLKPCGMTNAVLDPDAATPDFTRSFDESYVEDEPDIYMSGWVALTTEDMYRWVECLKSGNLISKENLAGLSESFRPSSQSPMGQTAYEGEKMIFRYHHGQSQNFEAGVAWIPDPGHTIILLTNNRCNELGDHINAIDAILRGEEFGIPKRSIELSLRAKILHEGYEAGAAFLNSIRKDQADIYNFQQEEKELINTGTWLFEKQRKDDGLKMLKFTATRFPESIPAHLTLAGAYEDLGKVDQAFKHYRKVKDLDPQNKLAAAKLKELE